MAFVPATTCQFVKTNGDKCRHKVRAGSFCWQHTKGPGNRWRSLGTPARIVWTIVLALIGGAAVQWWQSHTTERNLEARVGKEIRTNLDHLSTKMEILVTKPVIYKEPDDPNGVAIDRLERARNIAFETKVYEATISSSSAMGAASEITDFYNALELAAKFEACTLAIDKGERERQFLMGVYAWQRTEHVKQLYTTLFVYGSELLIERLHQASPTLPSDLADEIGKLQKLTQAAARGLNTSTLQALEGRLVDVEMAVTKCEEFKSRLRSE